VELTAMHRGLRERYRGALLGLAAGDALGIDPGVLHSASLAKYAVAFLGVATAPVNGTTDRFSLGTAVLRVAPAVANRSVSLVLLTPRSATSARHWHAAVNRTKTDRRH
jgi:hypothetical protein